LRDLINSSLDDGLPARQIIEKLQASTNPPLPYPISAMNISDWRKTGYQRYLRQEEWRDQLRILRENGSDMSELADGPKFQETLIQIDRTEICAARKEGQLEPNSLNYIPLSNALARLNREALSLRKYNDLLNKEQTELKLLDINRELTEREHVAIVDRFDRIMEMPRPPGTICGSPKRRAPVSTDPIPAASFPEVGRGVLTAPPEFPNEAVPSNCPSTPSNPSSPLPSRPCSAETPDPARFTQREVTEATSGEA